MNFRKQLSFMKRFSLIIYFFLVALGMSYEFYSFEYLTVKAGQVPLLLLSLGLCLLYIIPLVALAIWYSKKSNRSIWWWVFAVVSGLYITGFMAGYANSFGDQFWSAVITNQDVYDNWSSALTAPFSEEFIKLVTTFFVAYLLQAKRLQDYALLGMGVGLGFQISEDFSYIVLSSSEMNDVFPQVFTRISGSVASHWLYTMMFTVGVVVCYRVLRGRLQFKPVYLVWLLAPLVSHFMWNSPLYYYVDILAVSSALLTALTLWVALDIYHHMDEVQELSEASMNSL